MKVNKEDSTAIATIGAVIAGQAHKVVTKDGRELVFIDTSGLEMHLMRTEEGLGLLGLAFDLEGVEGGPLGVVVPMVAVPSMIEKLVAVVNEDAEVGRATPPEDRG